jgi:hypothetical protein
VKWLILMTTTKKCQDWILMMTFWLCACDTYDPKGHRRFTNLKFKYIHFCPKVVRFYTLGGGARTQRLSLQRKGKTSSHREFVCSSGARNYDENECNRKNGAGNEWVDGTELRFQSRTHNAVTMCACSRVWEERRIGLGLKDLQRIYGDKTSFFRIIFETIPFHSNVRDETLGRNMPTTTYMCALKRSYLHIYVDNPPPRTSVWSAKFGCEWQWQWMNEWMNERMNERTNGQVMTQPLWCATLIDVR